ncbi:hypothetical protein B0H21DRAFT_242975 [Amylocystis lapponica]|nr:hypothetical protein B0H21DRAFT_242975 [Amylocystis lapponica]
MSAATIREQETSTSKPVFAVQNSILAASSSIAPYTAIILMEFAASSLRPERLVNYLIHAKDTQTNRCIIIHPRCYLAPIFRHRKKRHTWQMLHYFSPGMNLSTGNHCVQASQWILNHCLRYNAAHTAVANLIWSLRHREVQSSCSRRSAGFNVGAMYTCICIEVIVEQGRVQRSSRNKHMDKLITEVVRFSCVSTSGSLRSASCCTSMHSASTWRSLTASTSQN